MVTEDSTALVFLLKSIRPEKYREAKANPNVLPNPEPIHPSMNAAAIEAASLDSDRPAGAGEILPVG